MKTRISVTVDAGLLTELDRAPGFRSRSDAVESIIRRHLRGARAAVILAGGDPARLRIPELRTYRPLVPLGGRTLIEDTIAKLRAAGFSSVVIAGSPGLLAKLYEVLGDGKPLGVSVTYVQEQHPAGSAKTLELVRPSVSGDFLFLPCDFFFDFDLGAIEAFHRQHGAIATLAVHAGAGHGWRRGIVALEGPLITSYEEAPRAPKTTLVGLFLGFLSPAVFAQIPPGSLAWSLQEQVFPRLARQGRLAGCPVSGNWVNVHTKADAELARRLVREETQKEERQ